MSAHDNVLKAFPRSAINGFMKGVLQDSKGPHEKLSRSSDGGPERLLRSSGVPCGEIPKGFCKASGKPPASETLGIR